MIHVTPSSVNRSRLMLAQSYEPYEPYRSYIETRPPDIAANILICLIHQTNYPLDQPLQALEKAFLVEGGLRRKGISGRSVYQMTASREQARGEGNCARATAPGKEAWQQASLPDSTETIRSSTWWAISILSCQFHSRS
jgi:four helix bundle suffix protein